jgi:hypothetical protein
LISIINRAMGRYPVSPHRPVLSAVIQHFFNALPLCLSKINRGSGSNREVVSMSLRYLAFMLRMWRDGSGDPPGQGEWRFSIQDTGTGVTFATLEELDLYLRKEMVASHPPQRSEDWPANRRAQTGSLPHPDDLANRIRFVENVVDDTPDGA